MSWRLQRKKRFTIFDIVDTVVQASGQTTQAHSMERRTELRRLQQQLRRNKKPLALSTSVHDTGLMILSFSDGLDGCLRAFLAREWDKMTTRQHERRGEAPLEPLAQPDDFRARAWLDIIRDRYEAWSMDDEISLITGTWPSPSRVQRAIEMVQNFRVKSWVVQQNEKGIAPSGPAVWRQRCVLHRRDESGSISEWREKTRAQRRRCQTWLQHWTFAQRIKKGQFKVGPALSEPVVRIKASSEMLSPVTARCPRLQMFFLASATKVYMSLCQN